LGFRYLELTGPIPLQPVPVTVARPLIPVRLLFSVFVQPVVWPAPETPVAAHFLVAMTRLIVGPRVVNWGALTALTAVTAVTAVMAVMAVTALKALKALTVAKALMAAKAEVNSMAAMTRGEASAVVKTVAVTRRP
jgi:hypothetical protein